MQIYLELLGQLTQVHVRWYTFRILTVLSSLQLMRTVARCAAMREYTPPEAPATYVFGSVRNECSSKTFSTLRSNVNVKIATLKSTCQ